jgi:hypothetical protein
MARALAVAAVALFGFTGGAEAHWSASRGTSLYVGRYAICNDHPERDVRCAGPSARRYLLADLTSKRADDVHRAAVYAVYFHLREAIPTLRDHLARQVQPADRGTHRELEINGLRGEAAYALAHLGDARSAGAIAELVADFETHGHGFLWQDTLAALAVIDPGRASRYAIDFMRRASNFKISMPGGGSKLKALPYIQRVDARAALPILERLAKQTESGDDHAHCEVMATRVRLDDTLRASVRKQFLGNYSGTWLPLCAEAVFEQLGDPVAPDDAAALVRHLGRSDNGMDYGMANLAYQRILDLEGATRLSNDPAAARAREVIRRGLLERSSWPHVADPKHRHYSLHFVVFHTAALAGLGDDEARRRLYAIIDDPNDKGDAWLAALWTLKLSLPGAQDKVGDLLVRVQQRQDEHRGVFEDIRTRVLEEFIARHLDDPRWTALVLDADRRIVVRPSDAAERALYRLSQHAPTQTCETVTTAARTITSFETLEFGLLALTTIGDACRPALARLAEDPRATAESRGVALEILGALRDPDLAARIGRASRSTVWKPGLERAKVWLRRR